MNRASPQCIDRELHRIVLSVEPFIDDSGQISLRVFDASDALCERGIAERENLRASGIAAQRHSVKEPDHAVRLVAAIDAQRVTGMGVFRRANTLRQRFPNPCGLEGFAHACDDALSRSKTRFPFLYRTL